ncbi:hypothetical protein HD597_002992 [Nonomuraea thailandensis]|uniref:Uncharacterized protein n=1 Tax=Nonomuraea thailandensis TaxID=1188745 RepID=A0A9X2K051_9ACTN|nr:hypothetical protein [Nonomuraea thailandensis]MCP2355972.1 hypothetical protein [Nonomuraea thailandensis]
MFATRHRPHPAYALAAGQGERFTHLFASGQISVRLIHAVSRTSTRATHGGKMSTGEDDFLHELEVEVEAELSLVEASRPEEVAGLPVSEWLFDPAEAEREEIGLRGLRDAVEVLEDGARPDDHVA